MKKEKRRKIARWKRILLAILCIWLLLLVAGVVVIQVFTVENVIVEGNELYDEKQIEEAVLNDEYSWNSLYVIIKYKFMEPARIPFVDAMDISLQNPHTLHIHVYEKGHLGYVKIAGTGENAYFDKDGIVTEISDRFIDGIPQIKGLELDEIVLYDNLPIEEERLRELLTLTQTLKRKDLVPDHISYATKHSPVLYYGDVRVQLGGIENLTQKVDRMAKILPTLENLAGTLHLENWTEENTNIVFEKEQ